MAAAAFITLLMMHAPADGAPSDKSSVTLEASQLALKAFMNKRLPVSDLAARAVGGATTPKAKTGPFLEAITRFKKEVERYRKRHGAIIKRAHALILAKNKGRYGRVSFSRGFKSYLKVVPQLSGAHLALYGKSGLPEPLEIGFDRGTELDAIGVLLGARGLDELSRRRYGQAKKWFTRQVRYGALMFDAARTYQGLASGLSLVQTGIGLLKVHAWRSTSKPDLKEIARLRALRAELGSLSRSLSKIHRALHDVSDMKLWLATAKNPRSRIWLYEALQALSRIARKAKSAIKRAEARRYLQQIADDEGRGAKMAKRILEVRLRPPTKAK